MPRFSEIIKLVAVPFAIPARIYNSIMSRIKFFSGAEVEEKQEKKKDSITNVIVVIPRGIVNTVIKDSLVHTIQTETGAVLHFNYKNLTFEKKPHTMTISGSLEACQKAKELFEKAILDAEMEISLSDLNITQEDTVASQSVDSEDGEISTLTAKRCDSFMAIFNDFVKVEPLRMESPHCFIMKIFHGKWNPLGPMLKEYAQYLESEEIRKSLKVTTPQKGDLVAVRVEENEGLVVYRAEVTLLLPDRGLIELTQVDTSNPMLVEEHTNLYKLSPELFNFPEQTIECGLTGVEPLEEDECWSETSNYMFAELTACRENPTFAKAVSFTRTTDIEGHTIVKPWVQLWEFGGEEDVDISEQLVDCGSARRSSSRIT